MEVQLLTADKSVPKVPGLQVPTAQEGADTEQAGAKVYVGQICHHRIRHVVRLVHVIAGTDLFSHKVDCLTRVVMQKP